MGFNVSIGGTTFDLILSSPKIEASIVSTKFFPAEDSEDSDAVVELNGFTGTLVIRHPRNSNQERSQIENDSFVESIEDEKSSSMTAKPVYNTLFGPFKRSDKDTCIEENYGRAKPLKREGSSQASSLRVIKQNKKIENQNGNSSFIGSVGESENSLSLIAKPYKSNDKEIVIAEENYGRAKPLKRESSSQISSPTEIKSFKKLPRYQEIKLRNRLKAYGDSTRSLAYDLDDFKEDNKNDLQNSDNIDESMVQSYAQKDWINTEQNNPYNRNRTRLHRACESSIATFPLLYKILKENPDNASTLDLNGNTPLHVIALNEDLLIGSSAITTQFFIEDLIKIYPGKSY